MLHHGITNCATARKLVECTIAAVSANHPGRANMFAELLAALSDSCSGGVIFQVLRMS